jgi:hypothetical protein
MHQRLGMSSGPPAETFGTEPESVEHHGKTLLTGN